jgi:hypothetical protein
MFFPSAVLCASSVFLLVIKKRLTQSYTEITQWITEKRIKSFLRYFISAILSTIFLASCEEVIKVDLNSADPALVIEGIIEKDSLALVRLTKTTSYFSHEEPVIVENARIRIKDGMNTEDLEYTGNGYYKGDTIIGTEGIGYEVEVLHDGIKYTGSSYMPHKTEIQNIWYSKDNTPTILNPKGETVFTISFDFIDDPGKDNFYMVRFISDGELLEKRYFLFTENKTNGGSLGHDGNHYTFAESIFFEGGEVRVEFLSVDEPVYDYFIQLDDVLFWKRRALPPTPYNPESNIDPSVLGYFAAWAGDFEQFNLE